MRRMNALILRFLALGSAIVGIHARGDTKRKNHVVSRETIASRPPANLIQRFDVNTPRTSMTPRPGIDETIMKLPVGEGPGVLPDFPQATRDYWLGQGPPQAVWESVACPILDPEAFLDDPTSCILGDDREEGLTELFLAVLPDEDIRTFVLDIAVPIISANLAAPITALIGLIFTPICAILDFVGMIFPVVEDILGAIGDFIGGVGDFFDDVGDFFTDLFDIIEPAIDTDQEDITVSKCNNGHRETCFKTDYTISCTTCLETANATCAGCFTCYRPLEITTPNMSGLCLPTEIVRDRIKSLFTTQHLLGGLLANYVEDLNQSADIEVRRTLKESSGEAVDGRGTFVRHFQKSTQEVLDEVQTIAISTNNTALQQKVKELDSKVAVVLQKLNQGVKCTAFDGAEIINGSGQPGAKEEKTEPSEATEEGKKRTDTFLKDTYNLSDENLDQVYKTVLNMASSPIVTEAYGKIETEMKERLRDEDVQEEINEKLFENIKSKENSIKHALVEKASQKIKERFDRLKGRQGLGTNGFHADEKINISGRQLQEDTACNELVNTIQREIRNAITTFVTVILDTVLDVLDVVADSPIGQALEGVAGAIAVPTLFFEVLNPFAEARLLIFRLVTESFQNIAAACLLQCEDGDVECRNRLPTRAGSPIAITEARDGTLYLAGGCDGNFEGELEFYAILFTLIDAIIDVAGDSIPEPFNTPVQFVKLISRAAGALFDHMATTCGYVGGFVSSAVGPATFENTRLILRELLECTEVDTFQRGHGCDGVDNDCNMETDECAEDIFPPEIDVSAVLQQCGDKVFQTADEARECIVKFAAATDDCKPVEISIGEITGAETECMAETSIVATATGCGNRNPEDITMATVPIQIDTGDPEVYVLISGGSRIQGLGGYVDIGLSLTVEDERSKMCDQELDVEISVFSNEFDPSVDMAIPFEQIEWDLELNMGLYVEASTCLGSLTPCITDPTPILNGERVYTIVATVTDSAGRTGTDEKTVTILPVRRSGGTSKGKSRRQRRLEDASAGISSKGRTKRRRHTRVKRSIEDTVPAVDEVTQEEQLGEDTLFIIRQRFLLEKMKVPAGRIGPVF